MGKNIWYASLSNILPSFFTYIFIFIAAGSVGSYAIGVVSAITAFVTIVATINVLDVSLGMKRYLGIANTSGNFGQYKKILSSAMIFVLVTTIISISIIMIPNLGILELAGLDREYLPIIVAMIAAMGFRFVFSEALIASLRSKGLMLPIVIGSAVRFPILFITIYWFNSSIMGITLAYASMIFLSVFAYAFESLKIFRQSALKATEDLYSNTKLVVRAGLSSWIPHMISVLGSQLGIVAVFSMIGPGEGGQFYLSMAILTSLLFIVTGITRVSHALIAGMDNNEKRRDFLLNTLRMAFILTMPISTPLFFFPNNFLALVNTEFGSSGGVLQTFIISLPFAIFTEIIYYFSYGIGDHKSVLLQGIIGNSPRIILYFIFIPNLGIVGAALAYLIGSIAEFTYAMVVSRKHSIMPPFKMYGIIIAIPYGLSFLVWTLPLHFGISTLIIIFLSLLAYVKTHLFTDKDLSDVLYSVLPRNIAEQIYPSLSKAMKLLS